MIAIDHGKAPATNLGVGFDEQFVSSEQAVSLKEEESALEWKKLRADRSNDGRQS